jgi:hypothetical protein
MLSDILPRRTGEVALAQPSSETRAHVRALFEPAEVDQAEHMLISNCRPEQLGLRLDHTEALSRIRFAALRVSNGGLSELAEAISLSRIDWRDLLMAAGFADDVEAHLRWVPDLPKARFYRGTAIDRVLWYLHEPDLPASLNWARLRVFTNGSADSTFSAEGKSYGFENEAYASCILTEDEYVCFSKFDDEDERALGIRSADVVPPEWLDLPSKPFEYLGTY